MVFKTTISFTCGLYRFYPVLPMGKTDCFTQFYPTGFTHWVKRTCQPWMLVELSLEIGWLILVDCRRPVCARWQSSDIAVCTLQTAGASILGWSKKTKCEIKTKAPPEFFTLCTRTAVVKFQNDTATAKLCSISRHNLILGSQAIQWTGIEWQYLHNYLLIYLFIYI